MKPITPPEAYTLQGVDADVAHRRRRRQPLVVLAGHEIVVVVVAAAAAVGVATWHKDSGTPPPMPRTIPEPSPPQLAHTPRRHVVSHVADHQPPPPQW